MMYNSKGNKPAKFSGEMYGTKVSVEVDHSDISMDEMMDAFETLAIGLGYHPDSLREWITQRAEEYKEQDNQSENNEWDVTLEDGLEDDDCIEDEDWVVEHVINKLKQIEVDGDTMQYILEEVGMDEQMAIQLATKFPKTVVDHIYEMEIEGPKYDSAGYTTADRTPPYVSDDFQIGPNGAFERSEADYLDSIVAAIKANQIKKKKKS